MQSKGRLNIEKFYKQLKRVIKENLNMLGEKEQAAIAQSKTKFKKGDTK